MRYRFLTCFVAALMVSVPAASAWACGGFFCNAATQSPIYQAGERVVFAMHEDGVTMHIEIAYQGEPTDFGWIMPIEAPRDAQGEIKRLEEILYVSTADLFDALQQSTDPVYQATNTFEENSCQSDFGFDTAQSSPDSFADFASDSSGPTPPPVVVLQEANVGPYGAQLIQATDAAALYVWLEENGYTQDPAALPLLESYVDQELVFLGLRLQSGKSAGDIQPVQLELGETYACVPLRLTAIAATPDMPMLVWVLGPDRAIPKNFLHAVVNPLAIQWPGGSNYIDLVTEAVNSIAGRAFVTEYASNERMWDDRFWASWQQEALDDLNRATTLTEVVAAIERATSLSNDSEMRTVVQGVLAMPEGLTGFPYGNCYFDPNFEEPSGGSDGWGGEPFPCEPNEEHLTTPAEFYGYLEFWIDELALRETPITVDIDVLRTAVIEGWFGPRQRIQTMFDNAEWVTRFFTTISPPEMSRDPIFAFNADLGPHDNFHLLETTVRSDESCEYWWMDAEYPNGSKVRFACEEFRCSDRAGSVAPVPGQPALLRVEVLDESGAPQAFDAMAAGDVDGLLAMAYPGSPSLPAGYELPPAPKASIDPVELSVGNNGAVMATDAAPAAGCGCSSVRSDSSPMAGALAVLGLLGLVAVRRRRRQ